MAELDYEKEQISYLKVWLGILLVTDISLIGWFASHINSASMQILFSCVVAIIILGVGIFLIHKRIDRHLANIRGL